MRLDTSIRLEQQMKLSPRMIQAMEILQLPLMALQERIDAELQSNPVLEMGASRGLSADQSPADAQAGGELPERGERDLVLREGNEGEGFGRLSEFNDEYEPFVSDGPTYSRSVEGERDRKLSAMANTAAPQQSLQDYLLEQWMFIEAPPEVAAAGRALIGFIDDDGYLRTPLEEIATRSEPPVESEALQRALPLVQGLEPPGVAARDLKECLLLQLQAEAAAGHAVDLEIQLVSHYLRDIEMHRLAPISRRLGKSVEEIKAAIGSLAKLNPHPGSLVSTAAAPAITPDAIVDFDEDGEVVVLTPHGQSPHLYISRQYMRMAKDRRLDRDAKQFLRRNMQSAQWLIAAIAQRRQTVRRVVEEVFQVQRAFLEEGNEALKPLPMADVAAKVGVHVATVSRAVAGKYVQTPVGIFPLRMFFSGGKKNEAGEDVAWDAIRAKLKEIVEAEDKQAPLNDDEIAARLKAGGVTIARRTVAKYRDVLGIPPARKRRQY